MKKTITAIVLAVSMALPLPASAFGLNTEAWTFSSNVKVRSIEEGADQVVCIVPDSNTKILVIGRYYSDQIRIKVLEGRENGCTGYVYEHELKRTADQRRPGAFSWWPW